MYSLYYFNYDGKLMLYKEVNQNYKFCIAIGQVTLLIPKHNDFFSDTFFLVNTLYKILYGLGSPVFWTFLMVVSQPYFFSSTHTFYVLIPQILYSELRCACVSLSLVWHLRIKSVFWSLQCVISWASDLHILLPVGYFHINVL